MNLLNFFLPATISLQTHLTFLDLHIESFKVYFVDEFLDQWTGKNKKMMRSTSTLSVQQIISVL